MTTTDANELLDGSNPKDPSPNGAAANGNGAAPDAEAAPQTAPGGAGMTHKQILIVFSGLMLGMLLAALDQSIVSTALPTSAGDFHALDSSPGSSRRTCSPRR